MRAFTLGLTLLSATCLAQADELSEAEALWQQLEQLPTPKQCRFQQTKHLSSLSFPLITDGVVQRQDDSSIVWHTQFPIEEKLKLDQNAVFMDVDGEWQKQNTPASVATLLSALLANSAELYQAQFNLLSSSVDEASASYSMSLQAKQAPLSEALSSVSVSFSQQLDEIVIEDSLGDTTAITFSDCEQGEH